MLLRNIPRLYRKYTSALHGHHNGGRRVWFRKVLPEVVHDDPVTVERFQAFETVGVPLGHPKMPDVLAAHGGRDAVIKREARVCGQKRPAKFARGAAVEQIAHKAGIGRTETASQILCAAFRVGREGDLLVQTTSSGKSQKLAGAARDPVIASSPNGDGPVIACWESKLNGDSSVLAAQITLAGTSSRGKK